MRLLVGRQELNRFATSKTLAAGPGEQPAVMHFTDVPELGSHNNRT